MSAASPACLRNVVVDAAMPSAKRPRVASATLRGASRKLSRNALCIVVGGGGQTERWQHERAAIGSTLDERRVERQVRNIGDRVCRAQWLATRKRYRVQGQSMEFAVRRDDESPNTGHGISDRRQESLANRVKLRQVRGGAGRRKLIFAGANCRRRSSDSGDFRAADRRALDARLWSVRVHPEQEGVLSARVEGDYPGIWDRRNCHASFAFFWLAECSA